MDEVLEDGLACFLLELSAKCRSIASEQIREVLEIDVALIMQFEVSLAFLHHSFQTFPLRHLAQMADGRTQLYFSSQSIQQFEQKT